MKLQKLTPILWTKNLQETIEFYEKILGFSRLYQDDRFAALKRDSIEIMFIIPEDESEGSKDPKSKEDFFLKPHFTGSIYVDTDNVDELWEQIKDKVKVKYPVGNQPWLVRDFSIFDNNGYEVVFGQDISNTGSSLQIQNQKLK
jgi:uncharacterized glyoxalase superfamily protein PhnB